MKKSDVRWRGGLILLGVGIFLLAAMFVTQREAHRKGIVALAEHDALAQSELAAQMLAAALETGDFRVVGDFGEACREGGRRLTVYSVQGGVLYDSGGSRGEEGGRVEEEILGAISNGAAVFVRAEGGLGKRWIYSAHRIGDAVVRLANPMNEVEEILSRARAGRLVSVFVGMSVLLLGVVIVMRMTAHLRRVAQERDVQARAVVELQKVEEMRRNFISDMAHEIRTPLAGMMASVDLLRSGDALSKEERVELYQMLQEEGKRLNRLAEDILALARLEDRGKIKGMTGGIEFEEVDLGEVVRGVVERMRVRVEGAGMIMQEEAGGSVMVRGDAGLLEQAVTNLIENAVRHSGSKDVSVGVHLRKGVAEIVVSDHGCGIAKEDCERIFDRFYRVDRSRMRREDGGGTGLGLAIVRQIMRLHGGDVKVASQEREGTTFTLRFGVCPTRNEQS